MADTNNTVKHGGDGNTESSPVPLRSRNWEFVWHNYPENWKDIIKNMISFPGTRYSYQQEVGEETKSPHIQGCISYKHARSRTAMQKFIGDKIHFSVVRNIEKCLEYCNKIETRSGESFQNFKRVSKLKELRPWQKEVMDHYLSEPDDRTILWVYDEKGNNGKTFLCKHLYITYDDVTYVGGKSTDIKFAIANHIEEGKPLKCVLVDIPRSERTAPYKVLEELKNGLWFSNKYESKTVMTDDIHVIVFANFHYDDEEMSPDRWKLIVV